MSAVTSIEWTDRSWNVIRGCARISPGCEHCYAEKVAHRFSKMVKDKPGPYFGLTVLGKKGVRWTGEARFIPEALAEPLSWRKPQRVFVNSMSDLFHEDVSDEQIAAVFGVMAACPHLTFQVLTKRPARMLRWFKWIEQWSQHVPEGSNGCVRICLGQMDAHTSRKFHVEYPPWPLPNVWLGVSCEDQQRADERIPLLLRCPAAVRFVSAEPLLGPIDFTHMDVERPGLAGMYQINALTGRNTDMGRPCRDVAKLDWVIVGGESGPGAREHNVAWTGGIVRQCEKSGVPVFVKQLGAHAVDRNNAGFDGGDGDKWPACTDADFNSGYRFQGALVRIRLKNRKGNDPQEWPDFLRVRQFPTAAVSP